jgi:hypothetical protein
MRRVAIVMQRMVRGGEANSLIQIYKKSNLYVCVIKKSQDLSFLHGIVYTDLICITVRSVCNGKGQHIFIPFGRFSSLKPNLRRPMIILSVMKFPDGLR